MPDISTVQEKIYELLQEVPVFDMERVPDSRTNYNYLLPTVYDNVSKFQSIREFDDGCNKKYRNALLQLVSLECAMGASATRCRNWFRCLAEIACFPLKKNGQIADYLDTVIYFALAGDFTIARYDGWPQDIDTEQTSARVLYRLMTGIPIALPEDDPFFDGTYWLHIFNTVVNHDEQNAQLASEALADWWLHDYEVTETPIYDLSEYPCFEPDCNALLCVLMQREHFQIKFKEDRYKRFYLAALMDDGGGEV